MNDSWISVKDRLPAPGLTVFVKFNDCHHPRGRDICLAYLVKGISEEERAAMKRGELPDPFSVVWSGPDGFQSVRRSSLYRLGDVSGNNTVPYEWQCYSSPRTLFGQQVYAWMALEDYDSEVIFDE